MSPVFRLFIVIQLSNLYLNRTAGIHSSEVCQALLSFRNNYNSYMVVFRKEPCVYRLQLRF